MKRKRLYIIPQRYKTHDGQRPLSFAVYKGRDFLCYSWSLAGAWVALEFLRKARTGGIVQTGKTPETPCRF